MLGLTHIAPSQISRSIRTQSQHSHSEPESFYNVAEQDTQTMLRRIRDLSSEIQLLGDYPAARGVVSSIWLGKISNNRQVAVKLFVPNRATAHQVRFLIPCVLYSQWFLGFPARSTCMVSRDAS